MGKEDYYHVDDIYAIEQQDAIEKLEEEGYTITEPETITYTLEPVKGMEDIRLNIDDKEELLKEHIEVNLVSDKYKPEELPPSPPFLGKLPKKFWSEFLDEDKEDDSKPKLTYRAAANLLKFEKLTYLTGHLFFEFLQKYFNFMYYADLSWYELELALKKDLKRHMEHILSLYQHIKNTHSITIDLSDMDDDY